MPRNSRNTLRALAAFLLKPSRLLMALSLVAGTICTGSLAQMGQTTHTVGQSIHELMRAVPGADGFGERIAQPPIYPAYRNGSIIGYAFFSADILDSAGYSAKPINVAIGLDLQGHIVGAHLVAHSEPILILGITDAHLRSFVAQYRGVDIRQSVQLRSVAGTGESMSVVDGISGATITSLTLNSLIVGSSRIVADGLNLFNRAGPGTAAALQDSFQPASWPDLRTDGSIARMTLTIGDVREAFRRQGVESVPGLDGAPEGNFLTIYAGLVTPAHIGRNLLGDRLYTDLVTNTGAGSAAIFIGATGLFSVKGTAYRRTGVFERLQIVQGSRTFQLRSDQQRSIERVAAREAPELRETALFVLPENSGFNLSEPWRLDLLVTRDHPDAGPISTAFSLPYQLPERYLSATPTRSATDPGHHGQLQADWREVWWARRFDILTLGVLLVVLTSALFFQDAIAKRPRVWARLRIGFLSVTLIWIGWYAAAQLSVVNVLTFANALLTGFDWTFFLLDPLLFILWSYVAVALIFWGRGVFCGWLCPFGALQELSNRVAQRLRVPQVRLPFGLHERLWPLKYVIFVGLFAVSLNSMVPAVIGAEVEPFKTAITLRFMREWPWILYALILLAASLFIERFFCRYLCPLGAALALPARLRMFQWLKRHWQCGRECRICEMRCPVQAIHPTGEINPNECIYCLKCQNLYFDTHVCPPMIARRKRRENRYGGALEGDSARQARKSVEAKS